VFKESGDLNAFDDALANEQRAIDAWSDIVQAASGVYSEKLPFGAPGYFPRHWKEELQHLQADFERLVAARKAASPAPNVKVPRTAQPALDETSASAVLASAPTATGGRDFAVTAKVTSNVEIKWVRLRYRHLTQFEDYQVAEMTFDEAAKSYQGRIPASFIDSKWDLMYFVEVMDRQGHGRMYPDFEKETPYVVVSVQR
jgi:hypothetical protein